MIPILCSNKFDWFWIVMDHGVMIHGGAESALFIGRPMSWAISAIERPQNKLHRHLEISWKRISLEYWTIYFWLFASAIYRFELSEIELFMNLICWLNVKTEVVIMWRWTSRRHLIWSSITIWTNQIKAWIGLWDRIYLGNLLKWHFSGRRICFI